MLAVVLFLAAPSSQPASQPASQQVLDPQTVIKLRATEERVNTLKEKIFRAKARLMLLQDAMMHGTITGARARFVHKNDMGGSFKLEQVEYLLDGTPLYSKVDTDGSLPDEFELFNGSIVPGEHTISVTLVYRGNGFGVFSYLNEYTFKIPSSYTFKAEEGKQIVIKVTAYEKGGITTDLKERPSVKYEVEVLKELRGPSSAPRP